MSLSASIRSLLVFGLLGLGCERGPSDVNGVGAFAPGARRVLFIGNSLTYANDLPAMLESIAASAGDTAIEARQAAFPDFSLEDHWLEGTAARMLAATTWDVVVMQQGPSSLPENQVYLATWVARFAPLIRASGAVPALYMVWPASARAGDFPAVRTSYANAAKSVDGLFLPAGSAWQLAWARDPSLPLYGGDGFHPSSLGTYLAALVIYEGVTRHSVVGLPAPLALGLTPDRLRVLQDAAHQAILDTR